MALAVFLVILTLVIVPEQGGNISSTSIEAQGISTANSSYNETLPIQDVDLGSTGRSVFIAVVMLAHMLFANLQSAGRGLRQGRKRHISGQKRKAQNDLPGRLPCLMSSCSVPGQHLPSPASSFFLAVPCICKPGFPHLLVAPLSGGIHVRPRNIVPVFVCFSWTYCPGEVTRHSATHSP